MANGKSVARVFYQWLKILHFKERGLTASYGDNNITTPYSLRPERTLVQPFHVQRYKMIFKFKRMSKIFDEKNTSPWGTLTTPPSNPEAGGVTLPPSDVTKGKDITNSANLQIYFDKEGNHLIFKRNWKKKGRPFKVLLSKSPVQVCPINFLSIKALRTHPETSICREKLPHRLACL